MEVQNGRVTNIMICYLENDILVLMEPLRGSTWFECLSKIKSRSGSKVMVDLSLNPYQGNVLRDSRPLPKSLPRSGRDLKSVNPIIGNNNVKNNEVDTSCRR